MKVVLGMFFLALSNVDVKFDTRKWSLRKYIIAEAMPITKQVELIDKHEFVEVAFDKALEIFVVHMAVLEASVSIIIIYSTKKLFLVTSEQDKTPIESSIEYSDFIDIFSLNLVMELLDRTGINEHAIKLVDSKPPLYGPIYSLSLIELKILKMYIKTYQKTGFMRPSKSSARAPILFNKEFDGNLHLYINYQGQNNLTMKNYIDYL